MLNTVWTELKKPSGILAVVLTVIAAIFGILYPLLSEKHGALTYSVQQAVAFDRSKITINPSSNNEGIIITRKDGSKIDKNVYVATLKIWNSGDDEIKPDDVRIPFKIEMTGSNDIIDISKSFETKNNMDRFELNRDRVLSWSHFDPNQGLTINIVYYSDSQSFISVSGFAVKSKEITVADTRTLNVLDGRIFWPALKGILICFLIDYAGRPGSSLIKKRGKASIIEWIFGVGGMIVEAFCLLYIVSLIVAKNHIEYAPF